MPIIETLGLALVTCAIPILLIVQINEHVANYAWPALSRRNRPAPAGRESGAAAAKG